MFWLALEADGDERQLGVDSGCEAKGCFGRIDAMRSSRLS
jgi:hypothetical protein